MIIFWISLATVTMRIQSFIGQVPMNDLILSISFKISDHLRKISERDIFHEVEEIIDVYV